MKRSFAIGLLLLLVLQAGCGRAVAANQTLAERRTVHVLMYHSILRDPARAGKYILSPDVLEEDIVWLLGHGYAIVAARELIAFVDGEGELPEKPVLLTFDDGYLNNLTYVLPILEKYDCCAVISIVGEYTRRYSETPDPNPSYAYVGWDEVAALAQSGRVEIGNHTYDLHGQNDRMGSARKRGESAADYERMFVGDVGRLQEELHARVGVTPDTFAYPYGVVDPLSVPLLKQLGFCVTLTCNERASTIVRGDAESLYALGRYNRPSGVSTEAFMEKVFGETETVFGE